MKLYHKVIAMPSAWRVQSILQNGLIPQVASAYKDLVPESIRNEPVIWLSERCKAFEGEPCFAVDTEDLDQNRLYHTAIVFEVDRDLPWWVYQEHIPPQVVTLESLRGEK